MNDYGHALSSRLALATLSHLGPDALPPMLRALTNAPIGERNFVQNAIMSDVVTCIHDPEYIPLLQATRGKNTDVFAAASNLLWRMSPVIVTNMLAN